MDKTKILEIIDKIKKGTPAKNFEDLHFKQQEKGCGAYQIC